jgi:MFS family permease
VGLAAGQLVYGPFSDRYGRRPTLYAGYGIYAAAALACAAAPSLGLLLAAVGLLVWAGGLAWFGRLPGDLRFEGERTRFYLPITSMVVVSVILTVVLNLARRWMG